MTESINQIPLAAAGCYLDMPVSHFRWLMEELGLEREVSGEFFGWLLLELDLASIPEGSIVDKVAIYGDNRALVIHVKYRADTICKRRKEIELFNSRAVIHQAVENGMYSIPLAVKIAEIRKRLKDDPGFTTKGTNTFVI